MKLKLKNLKISVVIPVFNSEEILFELFNHTKVILDQITKSNEIIFIDDGSKDSSWSLLTKIFMTNENVKIIQLTRNFGQHNALMCGFSEASGDFIITLDDDLQIPPEEIPKLLSKITEGYDIVYGEYLNKKHSFLRNLGSGLIQFLYKKIFNVGGNLTSFRIIKKNIVTQLLKYTKNYTFIDGLIAWQTRNIGYVLVKHSERKFGKSGYSFRKLFSLSINMLTNFSIFPLQFASIVGFVLSFMGLGMALFVIIKKILYGIPVSGFASTIVTITIFSGSQLITIGIIGEYIGRIHLNINNKPQYFINKKLIKK